MKQRIIALATSASLAHRTVIGAAMLLCLVVSGCSSNSDGNTASSDKKQTSADIDTNAASNTVPDFSGIYAAQLAKVYQSTDSDFVKQVILDGKVSDEELAEMRQRFTSCLGAFNIQDVEFAPDGALSVEGPQGVDEEFVPEKVHQCSTESGEADISYLHSMMRRNPDGLDENTIMAACLVRKGVVDSSYNADAYSRDLVNNTGPVADNSPDLPVFQECNADPLGILQ